MIVYLIKYINGKHEAWDNAIFFRSDAALEYVENIIKTSKTNAQVVEFDDQSDWRIKYEGLCKAINDNLIEQSGKLRGHLKTCGGCCDPDCEEIRKVFRNQAIE